MDFFLTTTQVLNMNAIDTVKTAAAQNIDKKIVISSAIGAALLGVVTYVAVKSGVKPLASAAKVAKNGTK